MPGRDGTGPLGMGPLSGRGLGYCSGVAAPYNRRGFRRMYYATVMPGWMRYGNYPTYDLYDTEFNEKDYLNEQAELLEFQLKQVKKRLAGYKNDTE